MSQGGPQPSVFYQERQALTRSPATPNAPSGLDSNSFFPNHTPGQGNALAGDGLVLGGVFAVSVSIWPNIGATLSGAGDLLCWLYNPFMAAQGLAGWSRLTDLDIDLSNTSGFPAFSTGSFTVPNRSGYVINWLTDQVTVSGGTDVLVRIDGFRSVGSQAA